MDATTTALQGRKRGNMSTEKNCQSCKYYKDGYCENLELKPCYPQKGCDDFSKRSELKEDAMQILEAYMRLDVIGFFDVKDAIKDLIEWSKNAYKQGWHDAIEQALKETHSVHTEDGHFRVIQEETLIGVGMAYEPPTKTVLYSGDGYADGYMVYDMAECPNCGYKYEDGDKDWGLPFCPNCGQSLDWESEVSDADSD